jgi:hypothetical protein
MILMIYYDTDVLHLYRLLATKKASQAYKAQKGNKTHKRDLDGPAILYYLPGPDGEAPSDAVKEQV